MSFVRCSSEHGSNSEEITLQIRCWTCQSEDYVFILLQEHIGFVPEDDDNDDDDDDDDVDVHFNDTE